LFIKNRYLVKDSIITLICFFPTEHSLVAVMIQTYWSGQLKRNLHLFNLSNKAQFFFEIGSKIKGKPVNFVSIEIYFYKINIKIIIIMRFFILRPFLQEEIKPFTAKNLTTFNDYIFSF
jgi:hypothetical protein